MQIDRIVLLSGMGGDARLMKPIRVAGTPVVAPDHISPKRGETLEQYAQRVADAHAIGPRDVIGGASFGGMVAAQISGLRKVAGIILLGSSVQPALLPASYRFVERIGRFVPDFFLGFRSWSPLVRWRFSPIDREAERCLIEMASDCPTSQIREFGRMIVRWDGVRTFECPVLSIHGDRDRIIPLKCARADVMLKNAGHAFTLTHAAETGRAIEEFIRRL